MKKINERITNPPVKKHPFGMFFVLEKSKH